MGSSHTLSDDYPRKHMNVMRKSINSIAKFASTLLQYLNQTSLKNVEQQQYHLLQHLIQTATTTEFGKLHHFDDLLNEGCKYQTFQTTIPISHYEDFYEQRIERMLKGEQQLTTPHDISMFARTGGTTSKKEKYIPLTKQFLHKNQLSGPLSLLLFYQKEHPHSNLFAGKTITISGGFFPNPFTNAENVGFISGILQRFTPGLMKYFKTPPETISLITDRDEKVQAMVQQTKGEHITGMAGIPLRCSHLLKEVLKATGKTNIHEVRPHFEVLRTGGTRFEPYRAEFDALWDKEKVQVRQSYNASEGFFAVQMEDNADDMLLLTHHGIFYECIPLTAYHTAMALQQPLEPLALPLSNVKLGEEYVLVISTSAGLRRYVVGDTIRFTATSPYKIQVTGRTKFFIDAFNEHTLLDHTEKAIKLTEETLSCKVKEYSVGANVDEKARRYEWVIEFSQAPEDLAVFEEVLDHNLQQTNDNYRAKRLENGGIQRNRVYQGKEGIFKDWFAQKGSSGGQSKVPKLSTTMIVIDELKKLL